MLGEGILKGLKETARNALGSFVSKERLTTVQYPEQRIPAAENRRDAPFLVFDGADWQAGMRCVASFASSASAPWPPLFGDKSSSAFLTVSFSPFACLHPAMNPSRNDNCHSDSFHLDFGTRTAQNRL